MGLRRLPLENWIELDSEFPSTHEIKAARIATRGNKCCQTLPQAVPAAHELLHELAKYLPARYPSLFEATQHGMRNILTGEVFDLDDLKEDPMATASRWVQDDLAIMMEDKEGRYRLVAGGILLAGFWRLEDKVGNMFFNFLFPPFILLDGSI